LAAVRYGQPGVAVTIVVVSVLAIWGTVHGSGPFAQASVHESLLFLQTFMGTVAATALVLGAVITERYRAEIALRESEERYRRLIEICPDAVALIAPDGAILLCNEQAAVVQGYPRDELTGRNAIDLFAAKDRPSADRWLKLSDWIATAGQALSEAEDDLASLITWWDEALADLAETHQGQNGRRSGRSACRERKTGPTGSRISCRPRRRELSPAHSSESGLQK